MGSNSDAKESNGSQQVSPRWFGLVMSTWKFLCWHNLCRFRVTWKTRTLSRMAGRTLVFLAGVAATSEPELAGLAAVDGNQVWIDDWLIIICLIWKYIWIGFLVGISCAGWKVIWCSWGGSTQRPNYKSYESMYIWIRWLSTNKIFFLNQSCENVYFLLRLGISRTCVA